MSAQDKVTDVLEYVRGGLHAIPGKDDGTLRSFPALHRLFNVIGMTVGFSAMKYLGDIMYGYSINGSQYKEIPKNKVPPPLRFLHGIIHCDHYSNDPKDEWLRVLHQMLPAAGGAIGAIQGSAVFFGPKAKSIGSIINKKEPLTPLEADTIAAWNQGKKWRLAAGATAWLSSVSGLTGLLYGTTLNSAFLLNNNAKTMAGAAEMFGLPFLRRFSNTQSKLGSGPAAALDSILKPTGKYLKVYSEKNAESFGKEVTSAVFTPLFRKLSKEEKEKIVQEVQSMFHNSHGNGAALRTKINDLLARHDIQEMGGGMLAGNNGWLGKAAELIDFGKTEEIRKRMVGYKVPEAGNRAGLAALGIGTAGAAALGGGVLAGSSKTAGIAEGQDLSKMSANDYVEALEKKRTASRGFVNGQLLRFGKWMGDVALAVVPVHRFSTALGLTAGGGVGLYLAKMLTGESLTTGVPPKDVPKIFDKEIFGKGKKLLGILAQRDGAGNFENKLRGLSGSYIFAACLAAGVLIGSKLAYRNTYKKNESPKSLEDYIARARMHHGDSMVPFVAGSSIFGSAAGTYLIPFVPGINYGSTLAYRTVSMMDRNVPTKGLKWMTGTTTDSYLSLREGLDYTLKYAVHNKSEKPQELEYYTLTILGPIAHASGIQLKAEQVHKFAEKMDVIRSKYWQEGGIPQEKKAALMEELKENFTGKGLDKTLYECGIDTLKIKFPEIGGFVGKFANLFGAKKKVEAEQKAYRKLAAEWRKDWMPAEGTSKDPEPVEQKEGSKSPVAANEVDEQHEREKRERYGQWKASEKASEEENSKSDKGMGFHGPVSSQTGASKVVKPGSPSNPPLPASDTQVQTAV